MQPLVCIATDEAKSLVSRRTEEDLDIGLRVSNTTPFYKGFYRHTKSTCIITKVHCGLSPTRLSLGLMFWKWTLSSQRMGL